MMSEMLVNYFIPHGHCYLWKPGLVGLHAISDCLITLAYFLIPVELIYIVKKRGDLPFDWVFMLFGSFIICCGITHIMEVWTLWHPNYWLAGYLKALTAVISLTTAALIIKLIPQVLAIPSTAQIAAANIALQNEVSQRQLAQDALSKLTCELEQRVQERTADLARANNLLQQENKERSIAEAALQVSELKYRKQAEQLTAAVQELQQTQAQLVQAEKMSSLGQMVAGIAHEINNPANFIYGNLHYLHEYFQGLLETVKLYQRHYPQPGKEIENQIRNLDLDFITEDAPRILASIKLGAERIQQVVKSLRNFSRLDEAEMKEVDICEGIDSTLLILQHRFKAQRHRLPIQVIKEYGALPLVECYPGQLNQVFMNIISNAIDALETKEWPQLDNSLLDGSSDRPTIRIRAKAIENRLVEVRIADNGIGISQAAIAKIYDPFYTTKPIGKGRGLGLAIAYSIVQQHGGELSCFSELNKGTEFIVTIPLHAQQQRPSYCQVS